MRAQPAQMSFNVSTNNRNMPFLPAYNGHPQPLPEPPRARNQAAVNIPMRRDMEEEKRPYVASDRPYVMNHRRASRRIANQPRPHYYQNISNSFSEIDDLVKDPTWYPNSHKRSEWE